jgi:hypothetical protein
MPWDIFDKTARQLAHNRVTFQSAQQQPKRNPDADQVHKVQGESRHHSSGK